MGQDANTPLKTIPGIGPSRERALGKLGLHALGDLLSYLPRSYEDRTVLQDIPPLSPEGPIAFRAMVTEAFHTDHIRKGMALTKGKISDHRVTVTVTFFNQSYVAQSLKYGEEYVFYGKITGDGTRRQMTNPYFEPLGADKLVGGITPLYPLTAGISQSLLGGLIRRAIPLCGTLEETLPPDLLEAHHLAPLPWALENIHFPSSWEALEQARRRLVFEELLCLSLGLALLRRRRREGGAIPLTKTDTAPFAAALPFPLTGAQRRAIEELGEDLTSPRPMNRLLQGDVGSGKTVVAAACIYLAAQNGLQSALMVPTELLARQHEKTLSALLTPLGLGVGLLLGSHTAAQKRKILKELEEGKINHIVGTHALLTERVQFSALGLVVTDEQHRFGVSQRATLSQKAGETEPHVLVMSATPIPRTLALMIYGDLDISILDELPPGRSPVETYVVGEDKRQRLYGFIRREVGKGRQAYIVCPTVEEGELELKAAEQYGQELRREVFPDLTLAIIHGRMKAKDKARIMEDFSAGRIQVLVSTTVIEVGVDVPNATLMVVENAERYGLSQLHQLRGRVGRGTEQSYCILIRAGGGETARERLKALKDTNDGFRLAEEDLRLRGPGDFFGNRQHGLPQLQVANLAGDMRILKEAQEEAGEILSREGARKEPAYQGLWAKVDKLLGAFQNSFN